MIAYLSELDKAVFFFINVRLANPITDFLMPLVTSDFLLRIIFAAAIVTMLAAGNSRLRWICLFSLMALLITDQVSALILKPLIARPRPCHVLSGIHLLVNCGAGMSMPSSHAANAYGQAALFAPVFPRFRVYFFAVAGLIAISRPFVGVHYPGDIIVGAFLGVLCGWVVQYIFGKVSNYLPGMATSRTKNTGILDEN